MKIIVRFVSTAALAACAVLSGCMTDGVVDIHQPTTARPDVPATRSAVYDTASSGAIFSNASFTPLFEDRRARHVGDTLTVNINEKLSASRSSDTSSQRTGSTTASVPKIAGLPGKFMQDTSINGSSDSKFEGKGATSSDNNFTGTITVTVTEVLANGNMLVAGEKQIGINRDSQTIRLSGVVNPNTIAGNAVSSTQIADARIDFRGKGGIDEAQTMGWLARFFLSVLPF